MNTKISICAIEKLSGNIVLPHKANKNKEYICSKSDCNRPLVFCNGDIKKPYFRHKQDTTTCNFYNNPYESPEHRNGKIYLCNILKTHKKILMIQSCNICEKKISKHIDIKNTYTVKEEHILDEEKHRADVAVFDTKNNMNIHYIFEIFYKHRTSPSVRQGNWFEIEALDVIDKYNTHNNEKILEISCIRKDVKCIECSLEEHIKEKLKKQRQKYIEEVVEKKIKGYEIRWKNIRWGLKKIIDENIYDELNIFCIKHIKKIRGDVCNYIFKRRYKKGLYCKRESNINDIFCKIHTKNKEIELEFDRLDNFSYTNDKIYDLFNDFCGYLKFIFFFKIDKIILRIYHRKLEVYNEDYPYIKEIKIDKNFSTIDLLKLALLKIIEIRDKNNIDNIKKCIKLIQEKKEKQKLEIIKKHCFNIYETGLYITLKGIVNAFLLRDGLFLYRDKIKLNGGIWCPDIKKWIVSYDDKNFEDWKKIKELLEKFGKIKFNQGK